MTTPTAAIHAEFFHPYFGWLDYERDFATPEAAIEWLRTYQCTPYTRHRVRVLSGEQSRVVWTDAQTSKAGRLS